MYVLVAEYEAQTGAADVIEGALNRMAAAVRESEPGCVQYQVSRSVEESNRFILYEVYADMEALEDHRSTEHFASILEADVIPRLAARKRAVYQVVV